MAVTLNTGPTLRGIAHTGNLIDELICYYGFEEGAGNIITDSHKGIIGTLTNVTFSQNSKLGSFSAESDYFGDIIYFGDQDTFASIYDKVTMSLWVNYRALGSTTGRLSYLVYLRHDNLRAGTGVYMDTSNRLFFYAYSYYDSPEYVRTNAINTTGTFIHIVCVANGIGNPLKIYVNGVESNVTNYSQFGPIISMRYTHHNIMNHGGNSAIDGFIDDVAIWKRALTYAEVLQLYNNGNGLAYPFNT